MAEDKVFDLKGFGSDVISPVVVFLTNLLLSSLSEHPLLDFFIAILNLLYSCKDQLLAGIDFPLSDCFPAEILSLDR